MILKHRKTWKEAFLEVFEAGVIGIDYFCYEGWYRCSILFGFVLFTSNPAGPYMNPPRGQVTVIYAVKL